MTARAQLAGSDARLATALTPLLAVVSLCSRQLIPQLLAAGRSQVQRKLPKSATWLGDVVRLPRAALASRRRRNNQRRALGRYAPGPLASHLARGARLEPGEREVTVIFVDVRGYTRFSEHLDAKAIYEFLNHYTALVSRVIQDFGGCVVDFHGDGMMAVFGAPDPLSNKEEAALGAARKILDATPSLGRPVGIGIATGTTFVGNLEAADRLIFCAVGNPTTTAARLQTLTRELGVAILMDESTWAHCATAESCGRHANVRLRGRTRPTDFFSVPLPVDETCWREQLQELRERKAADSRVWSEAAVA